MADQDDLKRVVQKDGKPLMISRYGARIMEIGGRLYLVAATQTNSPPRWCGTQRWLEAAT